MSITKYLVEDYRPKTEDELILPKHIKAAIHNFIKEGEIPHLILSGSPGTGKTASAIVMAEALDCSYIVINGSKERNIDVLRNEITDFAENESLLHPGKRKIVIIDEADYLNKDSTQPALRRFLEEYHESCRFIFTCNHKNKLIPAIHSRCGHLDYTIPSSEKSVLATQIYNRILEMLDVEPIQYKPVVIQKLVKMYFPDFRRMLNELQTYAAKSDSGNIDENILSLTNSTQLTDLIRFLKNKEFTNMRNWVNQNTDIDQSTLLSKLYDVMDEYVTDASKPDLILILDAYIEKAQTAIDPRINLAAACVHIMKQVQLK